MTVGRRGFGRGLGSALFGIGLAAAGCRGMPDPRFIQLGEARRQTTDLRVQLAETVNASDRAVMADTEEASLAFARQADATAAAVEEGTLALRARLDKLGNQDDLRTLEAFAAKFAEYRRLDRQVLALDQQNTNLRAQRLSFGPVSQAADAFRDALDAVARAAPVKDRDRVEALAARAALAVREVQVLQGPHIAEATEPGMTRLEKEMALRQATAHRALESLESARAGAPSAPLAAAAAALSRFDALSAQLIALSRQNSNLRSLELALRRQPALTAACDASLAALEDALAKEGFTGTR